MIACSKIARRSVWSKDKRKTPRRYCHRYSQRTKTVKEGGSGRIGPDQVGSYWLLQDVGFYAKWYWKPLNDLFFHFYFIFLLIYFNWKLITILWFLPYIDINQPQVCMCPPFPNPPHISLPIPSLGVVQSALFHALYLDWSSISRMVIYMFQFYSLKSSHPGFSHRVQNSVLYICVSLLSCT